MIQKKIGPQGLICPHPGAIYMYISEDEIFYPGYFGRCHPILNYNNLYEAGYMFCSLIHVYLLSFV